MATIYKPKKGTFRNEELDLVLEFIIQKENHEYLSCITIDDFNGSKFPTSIELEDGNFKVEPFYFPRSIIRNLLGILRIKELYVTQRLLPNKDNKKKFRIPKFGYHLIEVKIDCNVLVCVNGIEKRMNKVPSFIEYLVFNGETLTFTIENDIKEEGIDIIVRYPSNREIKLNIELLKEGNTIIDDVFEYDYVHTQFRRVLDT